jgi:3-deoxy-manno-octulosonate cytidylyltransferase (CMP-KDO synthetase)
VPRRRHIAIIPCRYGSSRFPGKPLALLAGKPLMWHVHNQCLQAKLVDDVVIATDDERIAEVCRLLEMRVEMTAVHPTGTDRVAECARRIEADGYVNVQGDEPLVSPTAIDTVIAALTCDEAFGVMAVNAYTPITDPAAVVDHNVVKVALRTDGHALAFSRQPIPYPRAERPSYLRQLGLYGFTPEGLGAFAKLRPGPVEEAESIEMLRFIENGIGVRMTAVDDEGIAVDTPEDLSRAEAVLSHG